MSKAIPENNNVIPALTVDDAAKAIALYTKAFGAKEVHRLESPDGSGKIMHACIMIGNCKLFVYDTNPQMCPTPSVSGFYVYFEDADAIHTQAKKAGMTETYGMNDSFWGDRCGGVKDAFGISWSIASHQRDVSPEELKEGAKTMMKKAA